MMDVLDYMERESGDTLKELMRAWADSFERAVKVATAQAGGAGAVAAWLLAQPSMQLGHRPLALLALAWGCAAVLLILGGALARDLDSGADVGQMAAVYRDADGDFSKRWTDDPALRALREAELNRRAKACAAYVAGLNQRGVVMNVALAISAVAPLAAVVWAAWPLLQH